MLDILLWVCCSPTLQSFQNWVFPPDLIDFFKYIIKPNPQVFYVFFDVCYIAPHFNDLSFTQVLHWFVSEIMYPTYDPRRHHHFTNKVILSDLIEPTPRSSCSLGDITFSQASQLILFFPSAPPHRNLCRIFSRESSTPCSYDKYFWFVKIDLKTWRHMEAFEDTYKVFEVNFWRTHPKNNVSSM